MEYYVGFQWPILDCSSCGCRFTRHDKNIHNWLHDQPNSSYGLYRELLGRSKLLFDQGNLAGLRAEFSATSKYKRVIEAIDPLGKEARVLELGSSRGHLTAYFILSGHSILGADVSSEAIEDARRAFGNFFEQAESAAVTERAPYDAIYHVGMIGCVEDPISITRGLLGLLKPEGLLFFNAPNADACSARGQLWIDASPPPDVVTLFRPGFWSTQFSASANVMEDVEMVGQEESFSISLGRIAGRRWKKPVPIRLEESIGDFKTRRRDGAGIGDRAWHVFERGARGVIRASGLLGLLPSQPSPFGLFVSMTKK